MCDQKTTATVIQYLCLKADSGHTYAPVYSYYVNGIEYQKTSVYSSTGRRFSVGDKVVLSYCSANPEIYYVEEEQSIIKFVSVILGIISAVMIIVSVCLAIGSIMV